MTNELADFLLAGPTRPQMPMAAMVKKAFRYPGIDPDFTARWPQSKKTTQQLLYKAQVKRDRKAANRLRIAEIEECRALTRACTLASLPALLRDDEQVG